jgi:hypothetical protein
MTHDVVVLSEQQALDLRQAGMTVPQMAEEALKSYRAEGMKARMSRPGRYLRRLLSVRAQ